MMDLQKFCNIFHNSYVCGMDAVKPYQQQGFQILTTDETNDKIVNLQAQGLNVHFSPNAIKDINERTRKTNLAKINAWFLDLDVEETKKVDSDFLLELREEKKEELFTTLFFEFDLEPSLVVNSRNGYHVYWFAEDATIENFNSTQQALVDKMGSDTGVLDPLRMLKVPFTTFWKRGETGVHQPESIIGTMQKYTEEAMITMCRGLKKKKPDLVTLKPLPLEKKYKRATFGNSWTEKLDSIPISEQINRISGHGLVNNENLSLKKSSAQKSNILANGNLTPCWVDHTTNSVYSSNSPGMKSLLQFCMWYGHSKEDVTKNLKLLFNIL